MGQASTNLNWVKGRHTVTLGFNIEHSQLNIINNTNATPTLSFTDMTALLTGNVTASSSSVFLGATNRYYRADQVGAFVQDNIRLNANLNLNLGVRYDFNGPLSEKYGKLTNFHPDVYQYNSSTDSVANTGLVVAGNNPTLGTSGVSDSTLTGRQWGFAPRIGIVWSPTELKNVVVRARASACSTIAANTSPNCPPARARESMDRSVLPWPRLSRSRLRQRRRARSRTRSSVRRFRPWSPTTRCSPAWSRMRRSCGPVPRATRLAATIRATRCHTPRTGVWTCNGSRSTAYR